MKNNNSFSISSETLSDFQAQIQEKIDEYGKPSLAILFANADLDLSGLHELLDKQEISHVGASSAGELHNEQFKQGIYSGLFMYLPDNSFKIYHTQSGISDLSGTALGLYANKAFENPGIFILIASKDSETDNIIREVQHNSHDNIPLYGGLAFDNLKFEKYTVFCDHYFEHTGIVAVIFDCNKIEISGDAYSGWDSMGITHTITRSIGNELIEIDGKPALDVFHAYFDYFDLEKVAAGEDTEYSIGDHPFKAIEPDGSSYLKSPMHINLERKSMIFYCSVPEGTRFKFCDNPEIEITDNLIERIRKIHTDKPDIDFFLITSCVGRHLVLGPFFKKEVKRLFELWQKPMAGFLSAGEIGNVTESNKSYFHNVTCVFMGFKVK